MRERRTEDAEENQEDGRRRQTHENGGETHRVAVVETRAANIEPVGWWVGCQILLPSSFTLH